MERGEESPLVYAIVVNWNGWRDTVRCLESLYASDYPALHVVVVDNGSTDGTVEFLSSWVAGLLGSSAPGYLDDAARPTVQQPGDLGIEQPGDSVAQELSNPTAQQLRNPATQQLSNSAPTELLCLERNGGFTGGVNAGLRLALERGADYAFLLNNDATVAPGCLAALVEAAESRPDVGLAGPKIVWANEPGRLWSAGMSVAWRRASINAHRDEADDGRFDGRRLVQGLSGCALLVKRAVLERVGLLDERYFAYYEDFDWCLRARRAGLRCLYVGDACVAHAGSASSNRGAGRSQSALVNYYGARNGLLFMATHAPRAARLLALASLSACLLAAEARVLAGGLALRRPNAGARARAIAAGMLDAARGRFGASDEVAM